MKLTYYELLMVTLDSPKKEIVHNFRKLAKEIHPDGKKKNEETIANKKIRELINAYKTLTDETKKQKYDSNLSEEEKKRIKENYQKLNKKSENEKNKFEEKEESLTTQLKKQGYNVRSYFENKIGYKYYKTHQKEGFILKDITSGKQIQLTLESDDCYKKFFKKSLFTKNYFLNDFYYYVPLLKEGVENRILCFENNIYIWRKNGAYKEIGTYQDFIIENCFLYHKLTEKSFFYECYTGMIFEITGFLDNAYQNKLEQKKEVKILHLHK